MTAVSRSRFASYAGELRDFNERIARDGGIPLAELDYAWEHVNGLAGRRLRESVGIAELRRIGAFFAGENLASLAVSSSDPASRKSILDPACGCGDLLLAAARRLAVEETAAETLASWGRVLRGRDRVPEFVDVTRLRLLLDAILRGARPSEHALDLAGLLPGIVEGNGLSSDLFSEADLVLANPPYGRVVAKPDTTWSSGLVTEAAIWIDKITKHLPTGATLAAILPDVIRSGSRYGKWRELFTTRIEVERVQIVGQFDALTDVDVFVLTGNRTKVPRGRARWFPNETDECLGDRCKISVGSVVEYRDPHRGPYMPYITASGVPLDGEYAPRKHRRWSGRVVRPPFVVVRRTSRPATTGSRVTPVLIRGNKPVAIENHLIVLEPQRRSLAACQQLIEILTLPQTSAWLDARIRTRHLTTQAVAEIPVAGTQD